MPAFLAATGAAVAFLGVLAAGDLSAFGDFFATGAFLTGADFLAGTAFFATVFGVLRPFLLPSFTGALGLPKPCANSKPQPAWSNIGPYPWSLIRELQNRAFGLREVMYPT